MAREKFQDGVWNLRDSFQYGVQKTHSLEILKNSTNVKFQLNQVNLKEHDSNLISMNVPGMANSVDEHLPERPFVALIIEGKVSTNQVSVVTGKGVKKIMSVRAGKGTLCRCDKDKKIKGDMAPSQFSQQLISIESMGVYRGTHLTRIMIYPFMVSANETIVYPDMEVTIDGGILYSDGDVLDVKNKLLMVGPAMMESALIDLKQLRQTQGHQVEYLAVDTNLSHDSIREWLKNEIAARKNELAAVLFVGHELLLPTFYRATKFSQQTPTDLPYVTFDGDSDWMPDVLSGRLPVMSGEELSIVVSKIIAYETKIDGNRQRKVMGIASNEGYNPTDAEYLLSMLRPLVSASNVDKYIFNQNDSNATADNITRRWSNGLDWVNYIGHGSGQSWPSIYGSEFNTGHIAKIAVSDRNPIVIDVACQNGRFNHQQRFGESLILKHIAGAAAYYGGSVDISWDPPAIMAIGINESVRPGEESILGTHLLKGQMHLIQNHSSVDDLRDNMTWYHLLGDPLTRVQF
jgi:hypothetical protein